MKPIAMVLCVAVLATACSSPASPDRPGSIRQPTRITVEGGDLLLVGIPQMFTATTDSVAQVAFQWGSSAPSVATVDAAGRVTAVGTGTATIFADARGLRGTKVIRTIPNFQGSWYVQIRVTRCEASGAYQRHCAFPPLDAPPYFTLIQDRDSISGGFSMANYDFTNFRGTDLAGSVAADGILSFTATGVDGHHGAEIVRLQNVRFESRTPSRLTGTFEQVWSGDGTGSVRYFCELTSGDRYPR